MLQTTLVLFCVTLCTVWAYSARGTEHFQQALTLEGHGRLPGEVHPRHKQPPFLELDETPEDLFKLEAFLSSDGRVLSGEVKTFTQLRERPHVGPIYEANTLVNSDEIVTNPQILNQRYSEFLPTSEYSDDIPAEPQIQGQRSSQWPPTLGNWDEIVANPEVLSQRSSQFPPTLGNSDDIVTNPPILSQRSSQLAPALRGNIPVVPQENTDQNTSHLRSPLSSVKSFIPSISWPSFKIPKIPTSFNIPKIPILSLLPKSLVNEILAAVVQDFVIEEVKAHYSKPPDSQQNKESLPKRAVKKVGTIATKVAVHEMISVAALSYLGPVGVLLAEEALFGLGKKIAQNLMSKGKPNA